MSHTLETQCRSSHLKGVLVRLTCSSWRGGGQRGLTLWTEILAVATKGVWGWQAAFWNPPSSLLAPRYDLAPQQVGTSSGTPQAQQLVDRA